MISGQNYTILSIDNLSGPAKSSFIELGIIPGQTFQVQHISSRHDWIHIITGWGDAYGLTLSEVSQISTIERT
tara:strand:+ start:371 stop:589 length:219 start_codon:yes stop_codon:yes gene_type:complete